MSGGVAFTQYQSEALIICLVGSIAWAGVLLLGARGVERWGSISSAERLWICALLLAVLPSLAAPTLAAFGVSLRPAHELIALESLEAGTVTVAPAIGGTQTTPSIEPFDFDKIIGAAAIIYVYGVFLALFLWASKNLGLYYAVWRAPQVDNPALLARINEWAERLDVRTPEIRRSRHVSSVCIFGVFRQTILIPEGIELRVSGDDLVLMCAHELAHVRRGDTRLFTATQLARVLFWFNPLVARIAANAELAAEESADALVLQRGVDRRTYAAVFVEGLKFAAYRMNAQPAFAPSFTPIDRHGRRRRLNSILSLEEPRKASFAMRMMLSATASAIALAAVGQAALAVDPESATMRRTALLDLPIFGDITQGFGERRVDAPAAGGTHAGIDIRAPKGAEVRAPGDGIVLDATDLYLGEPAWGKVVVIDHGHGLVTRYAHLDAYQVRKGEHVRAGDVIAAVGATGKVTGPHLHFETLQDGEAIDPASVIAATPEDPAEAPTPANAPTPIEDIGTWPAPIEAPEPAETPSPLEAPAPLAPYSSSSRFSAPASFDGSPALGISSSATTAVEPTGGIDGLPFTEPTGFAFTDGSDLTDRMMEDMEGRLLGSDSESGAVYDLTLRNGDKIYRFSSGEPMTAERREELRAALAEMHSAREETRRAAREAMRERDDAQRAAERAAREVERRHAELAWGKKEGDAFLRQFESFRWSAEERAAMRRELDVSRRDLLEMQREAIEEARVAIETDADADFENAFDDLDDAERDLEDTGLSSAEIERARKRIEAARMQLEHDRENHKRAINGSRRSLDAQQAEIERQIEAMDAQQASLE